MLPLHTCGRAGITISVFVPSQQILLTNGIPDARRISTGTLCVIAEEFFWMLYSRQTRLLGLLIVTLIRYEIQNNGDKFYHRKFMRAAKEKLTINELGPKYGSRWFLFRTFVYLHAEACPCTKVHRRTAATANVTTSFHTLTILVDE